MSVLVRMSLIICAVSLCFVACTAVEMRQISQQILQDRTTTENSPLSRYEIDLGLRDALRIGSERVIAQVGVENGYYNDGNIHISLPDRLEKVNNFAKEIGLSGAFSDLEKKLNRAAELAAPQAERLFIAAIKEMTIQDAHKILNGADDAATRYFEKAMTPELRRAMRPIIDHSLDQVEAVRAYNNLRHQFEAIPFSPKIDTDLSGYVVERGIAGLFFYLGREEAAIRNNPAKRTTAILKRLFGEF